MSAPDDKFTADLNDVFPISQTLLALDLGAKLGWALWQDGVVTSGTSDLSKSNHKRFEGPGMKFIRFTRLLKEFPRPTLVNYEEVRRHLGVDAAHAYGAYQGHLVSYCDGQDPQIPYESIPVATIKARATGKGNASKEEMVTACQTILNYSPVDDNESDARWLLVIMCETTGVAWPGGPVPTHQPKRKPTKRKKDKKTAP
jgi:crossover junction endodeoxyribonuclease RuvC